MSDEIEKINRAGMICFNLAGQVMIVSAMGKDDIWLFPKGHIEGSEEPYETAERECKEESGIIATALLDPVGITEYDYRGEHIICEWYTGLAKGLYKPVDPAEYLESDFRNVAWVSTEKALEMLSFPDLKQMLMNALCYPEVEVEDAGEDTNVNR